MSDHSMLCMGCMQPVNTEGICQNCGHDSQTPNPSHYLQPKTVLDSRYIVGKLLSFNGESGLYIGYDTITDSKVFIKEYMPDTICSRSTSGNEIAVDPLHVVQYKNYMSEFIELNKSLSRLRTMSHIVTPSDMFTANNTAYVILNHCEGITLNKYLQNNAGELSWDHVKKLFPPLLSTLGCVHNAGILHRGISLENIIVTDRGELKLTGFSIAEIRSIKTDLAPELYDGFSAPEQYDNTCWEGTWTDVYSIAAVIYRILTGCMPIEALSRINNDTLLEPAKINQHIPVNVSRVIMQAMRPQGELRTQTITDFVTKLFEQPAQPKGNGGHTQTIPISVAKQPIAKKAPAKKKQSGSNMMGATIALALVAVLAVVGLIVMFIPKSPSGDPATSTTPPNNSQVTTTQEPIASITTTGSNQSTVTTQPSGNPFLLPSFVGRKYTSVIENETWKGRIEFEVIYDYSDEYAEGLIIDQDIAAGTELYPVAKVKIYVCHGHATVVIPEYINSFGMKMTADDYVIMLDALNIKYEFRELLTPYDPSGYVMNVYCAETGEGAGGTINVAAGNTLYVDVSVYAPDQDAAG